LKDASVNPSIPDAPPLFRPVFAGILVIGLMAAAAIGWCAIAPLQSAAIAPGAVSLDSYRKTVQHYEGGIVKDILVREGREVAPGDVLIVLDETRGKASADALNAQIASEEKQLAFIQEEIAAMEALLAKGLAEKPRILELYRRRAELEGNRNLHRAQLMAATDVIARSVIRAPIAGTVVGLLVHTSGGVVQAGVPLMYIVPKDEPLVVEARIDPNDIDMVHRGQAAQVRLTPLNPRFTPPMPATVEWISADAMSDQRTGTSYYLARIRLMEPEVKLSGDVQLYPGMPAEVLLLTGERTFLEYLVAPMTRSFNRAFRED
jgi:multidrug efflux pump subunit AcrA (membrane-fusion protein)